MNKARQSYISMQQTTGRRTEIARVLRDEKTRDVVVSFKRNEFHLKIKKLKILASI